MVLGVAAAHRGRPRQGRALGCCSPRWAASCSTFCTFASGSTCSARATRLGARPQGVPLFGAAFFGITGLHMTHVTIGVIYLSIMAFGYGTGKFDADDVEVSGLYWHFVDLVWMFVFPMIYLMSIKLKG